MAKRTPKPALLPWAYVAVVALFLTLTAVFVSQAGALARAGISRSVYYLVLVLAGLGAAAFLDRALNATDATWVATHWFGKVRLTGTVAVFALVVAAGMYGTQPTVPLQLLVRVLPRGGDPEALARGKVHVSGGMFDATQDLSAAGITVFTRLAEDVRAQPVEVTASVPGYEEAIARLDGIPASQVVELPLVRVIPSSQVRGTVLSPDGEPVEGAEVDFDHGLAHATTDALGHFGADLPVASGSPIRIVVVFQKRVGHEGTYSVPNELTLRLRAK